MFHKCKYCDYQSPYRPNLRRHEKNKHGSHYQPDHSPHTQINSHQNALVTQNIYLQNKVNELQSLLRNQNVQVDQTFSMDTESVDLDTKSIPTDGEDTDEDRENNDHDLEKTNVDNLRNSIRKVYHNFIEIKDLRAEYRRELKNVKNFDMEQLRDILEDYADLEVEILDDQVGVDPEENGDGDETVEDESVDDNGDNEEKDTCTKCEKGCMFDFVFEMREVIEDAEKKLLENIIEKKKNEFLETKESENNDNSDNEEDDLNTKSDILQKHVENIENVCNKFREDDGVCFQDCSKSKIQSVCDLCGVMNNKLIRNKLKRKYPNKYAQLNETIRKIRKEDVRELTNPHVTIHKKRKTLQKAQVGEGILNIVKNLIVPELKELLNIR